MKFEFELRKEAENSRHRVELPARPETETAGSQEQFVIDGESLQADWAEVAPGAYSILLGGRSYEARVTPAAGNHSGTSGAWVVTIAEHDFYLESLDPRARRYAGQTTLRDGPQEVLAPMPGKVVRILVEPGQEVARDEGLLVIEAMKMQNELRAPRAGRVTELHVQEGAGIEAGSRLLKLE
jgi:biotin carboxyl carrier protein